MVVYLDLVFLTNLLIDAALLRMTAWSRKLSVRWWRIGIAAVIGASYVVMMFVPAASFLFTFALKLIFSFVMVWVAYGFGHLQHFLRNIGAFYLVNFCAAGCMFGLHYVLQSTGDIFNGIWFSHSGAMTFHYQTGLLFVSLSFMGSLWFFRSVTRSRHRTEARHQYLAEVAISLDETETTCQGLIDTGNRLFDPLTRTPVMVTELMLWKPYLPPAWFDRIRTLPAEEFVQVLDEGDAFPWRDRMRLVPYRGINKDTQFMLALKPDKVVVQHGGKEHECRKVLIGLQGSSLSAEHAYQAIIHPELVEM